LDPAKGMIKNLVQCELAYINTNHPDFITGSRAVSDTMEKVKKGSSAEEKSVASVQSLLAKPKKSPPAIGGVFNSSFDELPDDISKAEPTEREKIETEIISKPLFHRALTVDRIFDFELLQHCQEEHSGCCT